MPRQANMLHRPLRQRLATGTALAGGLAAMALATPALAGPTLPGTATVVSVASGVVGDVHVTTPDSSNKLVTVKDSTILSWDTYSIGNGGIVTYSGCVATCTVLNRVTGGTLSQIDGNIVATNSGTPINIWLVNTAGITVSKTGTFNGGSLVLSTLGDNAADATKLSGSAIEFATGAGAIKLDGAITSSGSVLLVGQSVEVTNTGPVAANISAGSGAAVLIAASDVNFPSGPGSPMSYLIKAGTSVPVSPLAVSGKVSAGNIMLGAMSPAGGVSALLQVSAGGVLTATANGGSVVLSTTNNGTASNGGGGLSSTGDTVSLNGAAINATGSGGKILAYAPVQLDADTTLTGAVTFNSTLDGGNKLTVTGDATFGAVVGGGTALTGISVSGKSTITGAVTTTAAQTYTGAVTLAADTTLTSTTNKTISLGQVTGAAHTLAIDSGTGATVLNGVDGTTNLTLTNGSLTLNTGTYKVKGGAAYSFGGPLSAQGTLTLGQATDFNQLTLLGATTLDSSAANGQISLSTVRGKQDLVVKTGTGTAIFNDLGTSANPLTTLTVTAGAIHFDGSTIYTSGDQSYTGPVTYTSTTALDSTKGNGAITLSSTVAGGANPLTIDAGTGAISIGGQVTNAAASTLTGGKISLAGFDGTGLTLTNSDTLTLGGGDYTIGSAAQAFGAATVSGTLTLGNATTFGTLTLAGTTKFDSSATNKALTFGKIDGAQDLTVDSGTALTTFGASVGNGTALKSLTVNTKAQIDGPFVKTSGKQDFKGGVTLGGDVLFDSSAGNGAITFEATLDGAHAAEMKAGTALTTFTGAVGDTTMLASLQVDGTSAINGGAVTTTGAQTYGGAVSLGANTALNSAASNGTLTLAQVTGGSHTLSLNSGTGATTLNGIDGTTDLTLTNGGLTLKTGTYKVKGGSAYAFNGATVQGTLTLGQATTFNTVTLGGTTTLDSSAANLGISLSSVSGAHDLTVKTGSATAYFNAVGTAGTPLTSLTVTGGLIQFDGSTIYTSGDQSYTGPVSYTSTTVLDSTAGNGAITLSSTVAGGANPLTIKAGTGAIGIGGQVTNAGASTLTGGKIALAGFDGTGLTLTNSDTLTLNGGDYTIGSADYTFGAATTNGILTLGQGTLFGGAVTLGSATTLDGSAGNHAITLGAAVNGAKAFTVKTGTAAITFEAQAGGTTALGAVNLVGGVVRIAGMDASALTITNGSTLRLDGGDYTIGSGPYAFGAATVDGTLTLGQATTFGDLTMAAATTLDTSAVNKAITLGSVDGGYDFVAKAGTGAIGVAGHLGTVGTPLASIALSGAIGFDAASAYSVGAQTYTGDVAIGGDSTFDSTAGSGPIHFTGSLTAAAPTPDLTVNAKLGAVTIDGAIGTVAKPFGTVSLSGANIALNGVDANALTLGNTGTLFLHTGDYTIGAAPYTFGAATIDGTLTLGQATSFGATTLAASTTVTGGVANFTGTVDGAFALQVSGDASFGGVVGGTAPLASLTVTGKSTLNGGKIVTTGNQDYQGATTIGAATLLDSSAGNGDVTFGSTLDGGYALTVAAGTGAIDLTAQAGGVTPLGVVSLTGGDITLNGIKSADLILANSGALVLGAGAYTPHGGLAYSFLGSSKLSGTVTLGQTTIFTKAITLTGDTSVVGGNAEFSSTINGAHALSIADNAQFDAAVGGTTALKSLTVFGTTTIAGGAITTSGKQDYQGAVTLTADTVLDSTAGNGAIGFASTLDGGFALTTKAGTALTTFGGVVGGTTPLVSLTVTGAAAINGGKVVTTGSQDYQGDVALGADTLLDSSAGNGAITFAQALDGGFALTTKGGSGKTTFTGAVGGTVRLASLTVTGASAIDGGAVTTTGKQDYQAAVTLGADTTLDSSAGNGAIGFGSTLDGAFALTATAGTGQTTFGGAVGGTTKLASLIVTGTSAINGGAISTSGKQDYQGAVTLGADAVLDSSSGNGAITFEQALDGGHALTTKAGTAKTTFGGAVGATARLASLTVTGKSAINGGSVTTSGNQTYQGAVTLGADTVLDATAGNGAIGFGSALDGAFALTAKAGTGLTTFAGAVGGGSALTSLTVTGASALNGGAVTTSGKQDYQGAVTLGADTVLDSSAGNGAIGFGSTLDGGYALTAQAGTGPTTFGGAVGGTAKLKSLTVTGISTINGGAVGTTGNQHYQGAVTLGADTTLTSTAGTIAFDGTLDGFHALTSSAITGGTTFGGAVGSGARLASLTVAGTAAINGGGVTTSGAQDYQGAVTLGADATLDSSFGSGTVTFEKTLDGGQALTVNAGSAQTTFGGAVGGTARLASLTVTGTSALNGGAVTTSGKQDYLGAVALGANTVVDSSNGDGAITFAKTLDGGYTFQARSGNGLISFDGVVGGLNFLGSLTVSGPAAINTSQVWTTGAQDWQGAVTLGTTTTLDSHAGNGAITFEKTIDGNFGLTTSAGTGLTTVGGAIGGTTRLASLTVNGAAELDGGPVQTVGAQSYQGAITLGTATTLDSTVGNGAITLAKTIDGAFDLTVNAAGGLTTFGGAVGGTTRLTSLRVVGKSLINGGSVQTSGAQDYQDAVTLGADTTFDSSTGNGAITFEKTLDGGFALTSKAGTGQTTFGGAVGGTTRLASVTILGTSAINGGAVTTSGAQDYQGAVTLGAKTTLDSTAGNGAITFEKALDGAFDLTANAGTGLTTFGAAVGGNSALASLTVGGASALNGGSVTTSGKQDYQGAATLGADTVLDTSAGGGAIGFGSTLDGAFALTVKPGSGPTTFGGAVGGTTKLASLTVGGLGTINGGSVSTTGNQRYQGAVALGADTVLTSTAGTIAFDGTLDGFHALTASAITGGTTFGGAVGSGARLTSLTVTGTAAINGGGVTTSGAQDYQGAVTLGADATLDSSFGSGAVTFEKTLDGGQALTVNAGNALTTFDGAVGGTTKLASLTVAGTSAVNGGAVTTTGAQDYQGAVTLGAATTFDTSAGNGAITFEKTLDGAYAFTSKAGSGQTTFGGAVGGTARLASVTIVGTGVINGGGVATTGAQDYQGAVTLGADAILDSAAGNGTITFEKTLDGGHALTVNAGTALTTFSGAVGNTAKLASLTVTGTSAINGGAVGTTGTQTYQGAATLGADTAIAGSTATFATTLNGAQALGITGNAVFGGDVGGTAALTSLNVSGTTAINTAAITTAKDQTYGGAVTLGADATLTSSTTGVTFAGTLDGAHALTVKALQGTVAFNANVGGTSPLTSLTYTATGTTIAAPIVAGAITIVDSGASGSKLWLGDLAPYGAAGTPAGTDFVIGAPAFANLQTTGALTIDATGLGASGGMVLGNIAIARPVQTLNLYSLGQVFVWGKLLEDAAGTLGAIQIGGDATATGLAAQISMIATRDGGITETPTSATASTNPGAAILAPTATVAFNGAAIAAGQDAGFLGLLGMTPAKTISQAQAQGMINNPGSALYYAGVSGGAPYSTTGLIVAAKLQVRFKNFALFQNTGLPGLNSGVTLGSVAKPSTPALTIVGGGTANDDPFAVFGTINGVTGISTALLGATYIVPSAISVPISRINGCVIGSSAGCITPAPLSTVLNAVDASRVTIFYANTDYVVAFDPLVGTNNEALFNDFGSLGIGDVRDPAPACRPGDKTCVQQKGAQR